MGKNNYEQRLIPAEELIGKCNINYNELLANYEATKEHRINIPNSTSPLLLEKEAERFLENKLRDILN
jgi:hypothetical protein